MSEKVQKADFELKYRVWELQSLYDVGLSIARTLDLESLAEDVLMTSVSLLNARSGSLLVRAQGDEGFFAKHVGEPLLSADALYEVPAEAVLANTRDRRPAFLENAPAEKLLLVPIAVENRALGVLVVADKETRGGGVDDFTASDVRVASLFANQAAIALENARLHQRGRREGEDGARDGARGLHPEDDSPRRAPGGRRAPPRGREPPHEAGRRRLLRRLPAAGRPHGALRRGRLGQGRPGGAPRVDRPRVPPPPRSRTSRGDLPALVARVNKHLVRFSSTRKFATLFVAVFDPASGLLRYVNAGHNPGPLALAGRRDAPAERRRSRRDDAGRRPPRGRRDRSSPGDTLLLYSDGITEALNRDDEEFGMERLTQLALDGRGGASGRALAAASSGP